MSLSRSPRYCSAVVFGLVTALSLSACQVSPLYGDRSLSASNNVAASVAVDPVGDRVSQEVRNQLIFLFQGGAGAPADPRYRLQLSVNRSVQGILREAIDGQPTGQTLTLSAQYRLVEVASTREVASGSQEIAVSYDDFDQAFADVRAMRDAEDRGARELAQRISTDVAMTLRAERARVPDQGT
ncbi:LPS assembly lipoprotein LptE [Pararhizobium haloflavum]|uniref:LPS assembly lipoprotein LptE n=1 Tax=Pararhizobium haloflavum TaxID=2037914 RepID=UPI0012FFEBF2|nr:LPS assembly lipoprotein LptE [Pararhizobium haloflavum]